MLPLVESGQWKKKFSNLITLTTSYISHPCLVRQLYDGYLYWLFIADGDYTIQSNTKIKLYKSNDLENWTYVKDVVTTGGGAVWDNWRVHNPAVIYDRFETDSNKRWKLFYIGSNAGGTTINNKVGYAYASTPGGTWTKYASNPVYSPANMQWGLGVIRFNNMFFLIYSPSAANAINGVTATSPTGTWTSRGTLLSLDAGIAWEASQIRYASFWFNQGVWYIFYSGKGSAPNNHFQIGMATRAGKLIGTYERWDMNPIITYNNEAGEDDSHVLAPCLIQEDSGFYCLFDSRGTVSKGVGVRYLPKYGV